MKLLGKTRVGASHFDLAADSKRTARYVVAGAAQVVKLSVYCDGLGAGAGGQVVRGVIYDQSGVLVAQTVEALVTDGQQPGWVDLPFAKPGGVTLAAGVYDFGVHGGAQGATIRVYGDDLASLQQGLPPSTVKAGNQRVYLGIASGQTEARTDADLARYDVLILHIWHHDRIAGVKALNPAVKILAYKEMVGVNATPDGSGLYLSGVSKAEADANPSWYLVDATTGNPVPFTDFADTSFANQGLAAYQSRWIANVQAELQAFGFDGVFADDANDSYALHYGGNLQDPAGAPHAVLAQASYAAFTRSMLVALTAAFRPLGLLVIPNISNAVPLATWTDWVGIVDGATREFYTKFGTADSTGVAPVQPAVPNSRFITTDWANEVPPFQQAANAAGRGFLPIIYSVAADVKSKRYARASFLLDWDNTRSTLSGLCWDDGDHPTVDSYSPDWALVIGTPLGPKYLVDGGANWWARRFTGGYVVANATAAAHTFDLTGSLLVTQDGSAAGASMNVGAAEAHVFTGTPPPQPVLPFGKTSSGPFWNNNGSDSKQAVKFTLALNGQLVLKLSAYLDGNGPGAGSQNVKAVIYSDAAGAPGVLLATSAQQVIAHAQAAGWIDFTFATPPLLAAGTYWLGLIFDVNSNVSRWAYDNGAANQWAFNSDSYSDGPANPFGTPSYGNVVFSIYATFIDQYEGRGNTDSYADGAAAAFGAPTYIGYDLSLFATFVTLWAAGERSDEELARLPWDAAQKALDGGTDRPVLAVCGWYDPSFDGDDLGAFALVQQGGALADLVGERLAISTMNRRAVVVCKAAAVLNDGEDLAVPRRVYAALNLPAQVPIPVEVAVIQTQ